jgi:hypothetical protein
MNLIPATPGVSVETLSGPRPNGSQLPAPPEGLARHLCQVIGLNQNYASKVGTAYHLQIEDRGPLVDAVSETWVRRINVIVYANYGEPNARIIFGKDHDLPDVRSQEHNRLVEKRIQEIAQETLRIVEEREDRQVRRVKSLLREYHQTKREDAKREFEEVNALYPFVFSRAFLELRQERGRPAPADPERPAPVPAEQEGEVVYPLDSTLREQVLEIERVATELYQDIEELRAQGRADDILLQTVRKRLDRARDNLHRNDSADFATRRLEVTRSSLVTTWRQVRAILLRR